MRSSINSRLESWSSRIGEEDWLGMIGIAVSTEFWLLVLGPLIGLPDSILFVLSVMTVAAMVATITLLYYEWELRRLVGAAAISLALACLTLLGTVDDALTSLQHFCFSRAPVFALLLFALRGLAKLGEDSSLNGETCRQG